MQFVWTGAAALPALPWAAYPPPVDGGPTTAWDQDEYAPASEDEVVPPWGTEVFVAGLAKDTTEADLRHLFEPLGPLYCIRIPRDVVTGGSKGFAFVRYCCKDDAKRACKQLHMVEMAGCTISVVISEDNRTLFVGNLRKQWSKESFEMIMRSKFDGIAAVVMHADPASPDRNRGFAFVEFESHQIAARVLARMRFDDFNLEGVFVDVSWARPMREPDQETMSQVKAVYVANLPESLSADEEEIRKLLGRFGAIEKVILAMHIASTKRRDFAFVHFAERQAALGAIAAMNQTNVGGNILELSLRKPMERSVARMPRGPTECMGPGYKTKLCRYYAEGSCSKEDACPFAHGESELRVVVVSSSATDDGAGNGNHVINNNGITTTCSGLVMMGEMVGGMRAVADEKFKCLSDHNNKSVSPSLVVVAATHMNGSGMQEVYRHPSPPQLNNTNNGGVSMIAHSLPRSFLAAAAAAASNTTTTPTTTTPPPTHTPTTTTIAATAGSGDAISSSTSPNRQPQPQPQPQSNHHPVVVVVYPNNHNNSDTNNNHHHHHHQLHVSSPLHHSPNSNTNPHSPGPRGRMVLPPQQQLPQAHNSPTRSMGMGAFPPHSNHLHHNNLNNISPTPTRGHASTHFGELVKQMAQKTRLCSFWKLGACAKGSACNFAHGIDDLRSEARYAALEQQEREQQLLLQQQHHAHVMMFDNGSTATTTSSSSNNSPTTRSPGRGSGVVMFGNNTSLHAAHLHQQPQQQQRLQRPSSFFFKTKLCQFHQEGKCAKLVDCPFAHGPDELRMVPIPPSLSFRRTGGGGGNEEGELSRINSAEMEKMVDPSMLDPTLNATPITPESEQSTPPAQSGSRVWKTADTTTTTTTTAREGGDGAATAGGGPVLRVSPFAPLVIGSADVASVLSLSQASQGSSNISSSPFRNSAF